MFGKSAAGEDMTKADRMAELQLEIIKRYAVMRADDNSEKRPELTEEELAANIRDLYPTTAVPREELTVRYQTRMRDLLKILLQPLDLESSNAEPLRLPEPIQNNNA
jgi:hypothetical protein